MQAWEDYRSCVVGKYTWPSCRNNTLGCFHEYLLGRFHHQETVSSFKSMSIPPWHEPSSCAILLEFRPLEDRLKWSIINALDNLPVPWCIQVVGSPAVLQVVRTSFPVEVAVAKIRFLDIGDGAGVTQVSRTGPKTSNEWIVCQHRHKLRNTSNTRHQESISVVLTDRSFYDRLLGDQWLFFQVT